MSERIYFLPVARECFGATMTDDEEEARQRHARRVSEQSREGNTMVTRPTRGKINMGICVIETPSEDAALEITMADPTIVSCSAAREHRAFRANPTRGRANS
jgi:hypothetical protein